jgi:hypothetical protein
MLWSDEADYDIHVFGSSTRLIDLLFFEVDAGDPKPASSPPPDVDPNTIKFEPRFKDPPNNHGVRVDTATGEVFRQASFPAGEHTLHSFVIEATAKTMPPASAEFRLPIRVNVHKSIKHLWLTPTPLTIRLGADGFRFTVLAQFDNDTVGDVTRHPGLRWTSLDPTITFLRLEAGGNDAPNGAFRASELTPSDGPWRKVRATLEGRSAEGEVRVLGPWSDVAKRAAEPVPGSPLGAAPPDAPNVLFLSEGFIDTPDASEKALFDTLVDNIVLELRTNAALTPFKYLAGSVNYWRAFVPSREQGGTVLSDLVVKNRSTMRGAEILDKHPYGLPLEPVRPNNGDIRNLSQLVYEVGLPIPADKSATESGMKRRWRALYGEDADNLNVGVFDQWRSLHDRRLANERDTAFGIANGQRPRLHQLESAVSMGIHPLRTPPYLQALANRPEHSHLEDFLANIEDARTGAVLPYWTPTPDSNSRRYVFFLVGGTRVGGTFSHGENESSSFIFSSLRPEVEVQLLPLGGNSRAVDIKPYRVPASPHTSVFNTVAHETAHAFGLDDEYGLSATLTIPATELGDLAKSGNVQGAESLKTNSKLDSVKLENDLKWRWPRIAKAGVLAAEPSLNANTGGYVVELRTPHAEPFPFALNDVVRFRLRDLLTAPSPSKRFIVTVEPDPSSSSVGYKLEVKPLFDEEIEPFVTGNFQAGDLLIAPVRGKPVVDDPLGKDLPIVAPIILTYLGTNGFPLNAPKNATAHTCSVDDNLKQEPRNLPSGLPVGRRHWKRQIVGLYDGGHGYHCGVYHPSGSCIMRSIKPPFCHVCRYLIVDRFVPTKHGVIDSEYRYPQP